MKIKITYYRKLPQYIWFTPEEMKRFSKEDRIKLSTTGGIDLRQVGYPVVEDRGTFYFVEEPS